jgi:Flp pilus assembly protein TadG
MCTLPVTKTCGRPSQRLVEHESGQSLVEFAIMVPVLIILLMGVVDLGRAYFTFLALRDAAAEGAYFGSVYPRCVSSADCANPNNMIYRIRQSAPSGGLVNWSDATISAVVPSPTPGQTLTVTVSYTYTIITPLANVIIGGQTMPLAARSISTIVSNAIP